MEIGTTPAGKQLYSREMGTATTATDNGLPTDLGCRTRIDARLLMRKGWRKGEVLQKWPWFRKPLRQGRR